MAVWKYLEQRLVSDQDPLSVVQAEILAAGKKAVAGCLAAWPAGRKRVLTISNSSLVCRILQNRPNAEIMVGEGLPTGEGRSLAEKLSSSGLNVKVVPDWDLPNRVADIDLIFTGADWVGRDGFVNKTGTGELLKQAGIADKPAFLAAESFKHIEERPDWGSHYWQEIIDPWGSRHCRVFEWIPVQLVPLPEGGYQIGTMETIGNGGG